MLGLPLGGSSATPSVRRPTFAIRFGESGGEGGLMGAAGALGLGAGSADPWAEALVSVRVEVGLLPASDVAILQVANESRAPSLAVGDAGAIELGYADSGNALVFTGQVDGVRHRIKGVTGYTITNGGALLTRLRLNQSYEGQAAGDIVQDLAGNAGVEVGAVENGIDYPFYALDDRRNACQHIAILARKSGCTARFTPEDKLDFKPFDPGDVVQTFTFGADLLSLELNHAAPLVGAVGTVGEGAASSQGQDAWSWLIKDPAPVRGSAGSSTLGRLFSDPALRSGEAAQNAADNLAGALSLLNLSGQIRVPGAPAVTPGSAFDVAGAPNDSLNGVCLAMWVRHHYSKQEGFISVIGFSKIGEDSSGGLAGLAGGLL